uniref:Uncharacterized protein n=1 Tax=Lepeophtheirus salmonis TaxID=72036 RepID=A0A0K2UWZ7_LEPSM
MFKMGLEWTLNF